MKKRSKEKNVAEEFFELDHERKIAQYTMEFGSPSELFDCNAVTKTPVLKIEFFEWIDRLFDCAPDGYKLDTRFLFTDMDGYSEEELEDICKKNILLERDICSRQTKKDDDQALLLCGIGLLFVLIFIFVKMAWTEQSVLREIIEFILEIAATVPFWSAADIYLVKNVKQRRKALNYVKRTHAITFQKKE